MKVILLAGGGGTRLWPLSTENKPKQFIQMPGLNMSLFQVTLQRALLICDAPEIVVVTIKQYQDMVIDQASIIGVNLTTKQLFLEPKRLNTLPAILAGVLYSRASDTEDILVLPSDHLFGDEASFVASVRRVVPYSKDFMCVFGVKASEPHTGYGYIKPAQLIDEGRYHVAQFKEKPDFQTAKRYVQDGYFWNAGIFLFQRSLFLSMVKEHVPSMFEAFVHSPNLTQAFLDHQEGISMDYGIMEHIKNIIMSEVSTSWIDLGSFDALSTLFDNPNSDLQQIAGQGSVLISDQPTRVVTIGVDDLIIVSTPSGLLICKKGQSELVKNIK
jgi:mannose-1-phosphate guanylyltransferase / mannose-6-phosphate isomerase